MSLFLFSLINPYVYTVMSHFLPSALRWQHQASWFPLVKLPQDGGGNLKMLNDKIIAQFKLYTVFTGLHLMVYYVEMITQIWYFHLRALTISYSLYKDEPMYCEANKSIIVKT